MYRARIVFVLAVAVLATVDLAYAGQDPTIGAEVAGRHIFGPPPPEPPDIQTRDAATGLTTVRATRAPEGFSFDGKLDEPVYGVVKPITGFYQVLPDNGKAATEHTEVWIFYDRNNVYVSARLWVKDPKTLIANELRRDKARQNDDFAVAFDTFYDRQTGFLFYTTPLGALGDCQVGEAQGATNCDYNAVWDVRTSRFDGGWTAEFKIPFKTIRYQPGKEQVWGVNFRRTIRHRNETTFLTKLPVTFGGGGIGRVSYAGTVVGIEAPEGSKNFDVKPYGISRLTSDNTVRPQLSNDATADFGVDVKYGLTPNLNADLTYNTDFAQVEADDQQVNLTRFNQAFPEKRDFFLEGSGIFSASGGGSPLFFSRQVGLSNQGRDIPIIGGARVTGKVGRNLIGVINITSKADEATRSPRTNFTVMRLKRDILKRSTIGATYTGRSQSLRQPGQSSHAYGVDAGFNLFDNLGLDGFYARADTPGLGGAKQSYGGNVSLTPDNWGVSLRHLFIDDDFTPEVGFVRRDNMRQTTATARVSRRPKSRTIRRLSLTGNFDYINNDTAHLRETSDDTATFNLEMHSSDSLNVELNRGYDMLLRPFRIAPTVTIPVGAYDTSTVRMSYTLGPQKRYNFAGSYEYGSFYGGNQHVFGINTARLAITSKLAVEPAISINWIDLPNGRFTTQLYRTRTTYTFAPRIFASAFVQYNSTNSTFSTNLRLRWEYEPGSEFFVVYTNDQNMNPLTPNRSSEMLNRALVVKFNKLFRF